MATKVLDNAKQIKADEFYTRLQDIEVELRHYKDQLKGKKIFCNCDDPYESNFFKYFAMNFDFLGLKQLVATCYIGSPISNKELSLYDYESFENKTTKVPHKIVINEAIDENKDGAFDLQDIVASLMKNKKNTLTRLKGDGDFRSDECIEILKNSDVVVTNPPFSLFREFVTLLTSLEKDFIVIGNTNALTYKEVFKLIKENKMRTGYTNFNVGMYFYVPDAYREFHKIQGNKKMVRVSTSCWYTTMRVKKHNEFITLYKKYSPDKYPKYDNFDAINVDKYYEIPYDYNGVVGVPITFLDKYNPDQFEILALGIVGSIDFTSNRKMEILDKNGKPTGKFTFNAKGTLYRLYDVKKDKTPAFKDVETGELYSSIYARVIIKNKRI